MLTSLNNSLIKEIRKLHRTKERRKQNLFLLEGTNLIESAIMENYPLKEVCFTAHWQENHPQLWERLTLLAQRIELVTPEILQAIATTVNPDGIVATATPRKLIMDQNLPLTLGLMVEKLQDPGNLGTMIRTAVATGVEVLWLSEESVDMENPKVLRASVGEWFRLPMIKDQCLREVIQTYQSNGMQIVATTPKGEKSYWEVDYTKPTIILLGNEGAGLSDELENLADHKVSLPLKNNVESLNVAIASAVLLYEIQRQRQ
jgi:TrmH family RNA methyltransferase